MSNKVGAAALGLLCGLASAQLAMAQPARFGDKDPSPPTVQPMVVANVDVDVEVASDTESDADGDSPRRERRSRTESNGAFKRKGTFFLAEFYGGFAFHDGLGGAGHIYIGTGGKLPKFPWRFYLIGGVGLGYVSHDEPVGGARLTERVLLDLQLGLRIYIPLTGPLRLFADVLPSWHMMWHSYEATLGHGLNGSDGVYATTLAFGLQSRVLHELSVGARFAARLGPDPLRRPDDPADLSATAGITWHL